MMLKPEQRHSEALPRTAFHSVPGAFKQGKSSRFPGDETLSRDSLLESLMPEDISPNKRAIIERLITLWQTQSELDIA